MNEQITPAQFRRNERLRRAVIKRDLESVRDLIARGASAQQLPGPGAPPLLAMAGDVEMARLLVDAGADPCALHLVEGMRPGEIIQFALDKAKSSGAGIPPAAAAVADYLETEARSRMENAELKASEPPLQMSEEENRVREIAKRF